MSVVYTFFSFGGGPGAGVEVLGAGPPDFEAGPPEKEENQGYLEQHLDAGLPDLKSGPTDIYEHKDYLQQVHLLAVVRISFFLQVLRGLSRV